MANEQENYDLEKVYDEKINPLMAQILAICKEHKFPMFASFVYKRTDEGVDCCTSYLSFPNRSPDELVEAKLAVTQKSLGMVAITITNNPSTKKS